MKKSHQQNWNENNPEKMKEIYNNFNKKKPVWAFRPDKSLSDWLNENKNENETNSQLVIRLLNELKELKEK